MADDPFEDTDFEPATSEASDATYRPEGADDETVREAVQAATGATDVEVEDAVRAGTEATDAEVEDAVTDAEPTEEATDAAVEAAVTEAERAPDEATQDEVDAAVDAAAPDEATQDEVDAAGRIDVNTDVDEQAIADEGRLGPGDAEPTYDDLDGKIEDAAEERDEPDRGQGGREL